ncbi:helix-turn-helix domain-containing protein [[Enterobacter] lignolyticus]|uniref:Transcriptional regulator, XRE family n=2 Tax=[Enterobacter] lignolyticus TaxID=1334193 RepID=E3G264_ENTLS|nr:transcriptional regulator, XRE family [[Enterobacter] lignolyticus SCF1]ALR76155.1 XRE family transcriptional regulator [[Enterobacter] lignolyticus]
MSRDLFTELTEGMHAWQESNEGKRTLKTHRLATQDILLTAEDIRGIRRRLNLSQALFARYLHTALKTYQNWEQGVARPNKQAMLLLRIVEKQPAALHLLATLS